VVWVLLPERVVRRAQASGPVSVSRQRQGLLCRLACRRHRGGQADRVRPS